MHKSKLFTKCISMLITAAVLLSTVPVITSAETTAEDVVEVVEATSVMEVSETDDAFPQTYGDAATAEELEQALANGTDAIRITDNFMIDRTFYVTSDTIIYSDQARTLTRATDFGGDIFVVGEDADGNACSETAILKLGDPGSSGSNMLVIDGNSANMTVDVVGSVIFVCGNAQADLYENLTVTNAKKVGNERALLETHGLTNTKYIGGAVAVLAKDSLMNIYGGTYSNNSVNESGNSVYGGAFYNFSTLNVYGGLFEGNSALRAAVFYNYRTLNIYRAVIRNNSATLGGTIYVPASTGAFLYTGGDNDVVESSVIFSGNTATTGGAIASAGRVDIKNTVFENNTAVESGGAFYGSGSYNVVKIADSRFDTNTANEFGGAIYMSGQSELADGEALKINNTDFTGNTGTTNGGAVYVLGGAQVYMTKVNFDGNSSSANGGAIYCTASSLEVDNAMFTDNAGYSGGALYMSESSTVTLNDITASGNDASKNGGVIYSSSSTLNMYNSGLNNNTAIAGSGIYLGSGAVSNLYKITFNGNVCDESNASNAGALFIYTSAAKVLIHSCTFINNTSSGLGGAMLISGKSDVDIYNLTATGNSAAKGGVIYETTAGTVVNISGMTVQGNTATTGGPVIWGNTANAKLYINKSNYTDLDVSGALDSTYWSGAIYNKLTVNEITTEIPTYTDYGNESMGTLWNSVDVTNAAELENALSTGASTIRITKDFTIDRTLYVTANTTIFSSTKHTVSRASGFMGDMFVVGEDSEGNACDAGVVLTLGNSISKTKDLFIINGGNVSAAGTALFVCNNAQVYAYDNVTFANHVKNSTNTRDEKYGVSVIGSAATVAEQGTLHVIGATFDSNSSAIYNHGALNIDGGIFKNNSGTNGGAVYNDASLNITSGTFVNNSAANGGAVYNIGNISTQDAVFESNTATVGGAIYGADGAIQINAVTFAKNSATDGGAVAVMNGSFGSYEVTYTENSATNGGAVYAAENTDAENPLTVTVSAGSFNSNTATNGGAIYCMTNGLDIDGVAFSANKASSDAGAVYIKNAVNAELRNLTADNNTANGNGGFLYADGAGVNLTGSTLTGNTADNGGAVAINTASGVTINNNNFNTNDADTNGGAVYICGGANGVAVSDCSFNSNSATDGGAVYATDNALEIKSSAFEANEAYYNGGAVSLDNAVGVVINNITTNGNTADNDGGFLYAAESELKIYNSTIKNNTAEFNGGAVAFEEGTVSEVFETLFEGNTAERNGGVVYVSASGAENTMHSCTFTGNSADSYGGVAYVTDACVYNMYNCEAVANSASRGGVIYIDKAGTTVNVNGLTVSGNSASSAGPIIYGNNTSAVLNLSKANYVDKDVAGELDDSYWKTAVLNNIVFNVTDASVPEYGNESAGDMIDAVDVSDAAELEAAIAAETKHIRIVSDFEIDRTFYITSDVTIFTTAKHTLTRANDFVGDVFVVGETADGVNSMIENSDAKLTLGNPASETENLLIIDGNKDNMSVSVAGTVVFVCYGAQANLYDNVTVTNCYKTDNERTYNEVHKLSRPNRVGGPVGIVAQGVLNVYGGIYKNNATGKELSSEEEDRNSTLGGVFYNESNIRIYDGTFENNESARGGVIYNYGITKILGGDFIANCGTAGGGVMYAPSAATGHMLIGSAGENATPVLFKDNVSEGNSGVIFSSVLCGLMVYGNTTFENNTSKGVGGAVNVTGMLTARGATFKNNSSASRGGAIYMANTTESYYTRFVNITNCTFDGNNSSAGGALAAYASDEEFSEGAIVTVSDSQFINNTATSGAAVYSDRKAALTVNNSVFTNNEASSEAGVMYLTGESITTINDSVLENNISGSHGGAVSLRGATLNVNNTEINTNTSATNGGAMYVAYVSAREVNSDLNLNNSSFTGNKANGSGGAIYVTRRDIEGDTQIVIARNTDFTDNTADSGGALTLGAGTENYFADVTFVGNSATSKTAEGGAIYLLGGSRVELDNAIFNKNSSRSMGGAIYATSSSTAVMNDVSASKNTAVGKGGFLYGEECDITVYDSSVKANTAVSGGGMYLFTNAVHKIYNTEFKNNVTTGDPGGAMFIYTGNSSLLHGCTFTGNKAESSMGGAIYISGETNAEMYNITATKNSAANGGFMYETKAGTNVLLKGLTVSGNTATDGGAIIWGNTTNAVLNLDKANYTDLDYSGELDDAYWTGAIANKLTVNDISAEETIVPDEDEYESTVEPETETPVVREDPVSVQPIFDLAKNSSDADINSTYNKFEKLDNSSNFMSKQTTTFENINGEDVTVDTFVYPPYGKADNMNVGQGLMIYQAMLYKQAHPDEEVYVDISSYRFSVQAAVNINRNSRYFGYMRNISGTEYDQYGFVRIAYLLVAAAKMGINVTVVGHQDAYPVTAGEPGLYDYFTGHLDDACDPAYVSNGTVDDYMNFQFCYWTLSAEGKGGTDMMHNKLCAVSHYLDMNGVEHKNAVWTSSSNLDGVNSKGYNGNWKLQTATIISDHEEIYRTSVNYVRLIADHCGQEDIIEFQDIMNTRSTEQIDLMLAGRADEIPDDEQVVYVGTENDDVFELYFTPFGGGRLAWDEVHNPYCKYVRELYDSEDYILFTWNAAEYATGFPLINQMEQMIVDAFHNNKNVKNKIYINAENFDSTRFDDLVVGEDIGYKSFNLYELGPIHNKDVQVSYVKDGQRYFVSLLNSLNIHSGSMYYQANFALVIKEKSCADDSVFATIADNSTTGDIVTHTYGEEKCEDGNTDVHGVRYRECVLCGDRMTTGIVHYGGEWILDRNATPAQNGIRHKECTICGCIVETVETVYESTDEDITTGELVGKKFTADTNSMVEVGSLNETPHTIEATVMLPTTLKDTARGGVIFGNNGTCTDKINLEVYINGQVRLYYVTDGIATDCKFTPDIRSDEPVHIAVTVDDEEKVARLYVDGEYQGRKNLKRTLPASADGYTIGGDSRAGNDQYFKGTIYSVNVFSDVRTAEEVAQDVNYVATTTEDLMYSTYFTEEVKSGLIGSYVMAGKTFNQSDINAIGETLADTPHTIEAMLHIPTSQTDRAGVIVGNYGVDADNALNLEVYSEGMLRLYYLNNGTKEDCMFYTDIRSDKPQHIAVTVNDGTASLYINGNLAETQTLSTDLPVATENFVIGGDYRADNAQYFKGTLYSVQLYSDARTESDIKQDMKYTSNDCDTLLYSTYFTKDGAISKRNGQTFDGSMLGAVDCSLAETPHTFEALVKVPTSQTDRAGVIVGNYGSGDDVINLEVYSYGKVRLYFKTEGKTIDCRFTKNIRSDVPQHIAVTVDGTTASLYVNGVFAESKELGYELPNVLNDYAIGGDHRDGNSQNFKGTVYAVNLFSDVRTEEEIKNDMLMVTAAEEGLLYSGYFASSEEKIVTEEDCHADIITVVDRNATETENGLMHTECTVCGETITISEITNDFQSVSHKDYSGLAGLAPDDMCEVENVFSTAPRTFEIRMQLSAEQEDRAGVLIGNYDGSSAEQINIEIYSGGVPRLYYKTKNKTYSYLFTTDVRSDSIQHLTITIDGLTAKLYLNGEYKESATLDVSIPSAYENYCIGGDNRTTDPQYFKGVIYSVNLFSDVRTDKEIAVDAIMVSDSADNLMYSKYFSAE